MSKRPTICYLCGKPLGRKASKDHVPPKQFFPTKLRGKYKVNLLTLPTHSECNRAYARDEEYFVFSLGASAMQATAGKFLWDDIRDRGRRSQGQVLIEMVLEEFQPRPGGIHLPSNLVAKRFDSARIFNVIWKITRGLFFHETQSLLPSNTPLWWDIVFRPEDIKPNMQSLFTAPLRVHGDRKDVFAYRFGHARKSHVEHYYWDMLIWETLLAQVVFHEPGCSCDQCEKARLPKHDHVPE